MDDPLVFSADEDFTADRLNRAFQALNLRVKAQEAQRSDFAAAERTLVSLGLERINEALLPAYQALVGLAQLGVLFSTSSTTSVTVGLGTRSFSVAEEDRERFAAASYLSAASAADGRIAMTGLLESYDRTAGELVIQVLTAAGSGDAADWIITACPPPIVPVVIDAGYFDAPPDDYAAIPFVSLTQLASLGGTF